jgi:hypothetical protein
VKCVSNLGDVVDDEECNMKLRPNDIENCDMGPCAKSWFLTEWSERVSVRWQRGSDQHLHVTRCPQTTQRPITRSDS